jgi:hypothetical protein
MICRYMDTPLRAVVCVSSESADNVITMLMLRRMIGKSVAATFNKVCNGVFMSCFL